jgi:hypothetical protein
MMGAVLWAIDLRNLTATPSTFGQGDGRGGTQSVTKL